MNNSEYAAIVAGSIRMIGPGATATMLQYVQRTTTMPKVKIGHMARTSGGKTVTVLEIDAHEAVIQYANNRTGIVPTSELTGLGEPQQEAIKVSAFRIPPDLKQAAAKQANQDGFTLTGVIVDLLAGYVAGTVKITS